LGTAEIEGAIKKHNDIAAVAVVGKPHDIKGEGVFAYIVLKDANSSDTQKLQSELNEVIKKEIGAIAYVDELAIVPDLPKTRSGKVMRRILRSLAKGEPITQDTSTLEDPTIVGKIDAIVNEA
jgi:acetyl-CoA synthetase